MTTWTSDELSRIEAADELRIEPRRGDGTLGKPVPIWVVRHGDHLYVRSYKAGAGAWFRTVQETHEGHIRAGGVDKDVTIEAETDPDIGHQIDAAYRAKYGRYGPTYIDAMVAPEVRATTRKLEPR
ncbi:DUF2255 family protein [Nonomuraea sp. CA-143628]|uniref:DUF2255 family protein n=1 Tax=Nonomuraea sp. CA-143628 TaxID=3239997 RepID=UPI003D8A215E